MFQVLQEVVIKQKKGDKIMPQIISKNSKTPRVATGCGNMYLTITDDAEVFLTLGKSGGCKQSFLDGIARLLHLILQTYIINKKIIDMIMNEKIEIKDKEDRALLDKFLDKIDHSLSKDNIIKELENIQCPQSVVSDGTQVKSCIDGIAIMLKEINKETGKQKE